MIFFLIKKIIIITFYAFGSSPVRDKGQRLLLIARAESVSTTPPVIETSAQKHCPQTTRKKQENPMESWIWDVWGGGGEPSASFGGP